MKRVFSDLLYKAVKDDIKESFQEVNIIDIELKEDCNIKVHFTARVPYTCGDREKLTYDIGHVTEEFDEYYENYYNHLK